MTFGKYNGYRIEDVPAEYLEHLIKINQESIDKFQGELGRRRPVEDATIDMFERVIQAGYRELSKKLHPDMGGDTKQMQELNGTVQALRDVAERIRGNV
jgi:hypothetical protein